MIRSGNEYDIGFDDCETAARNVDYKYFAVQQCNDNANPLGPCTHSNPNRCPVDTGFSVYCWGGNSLNENSNNERDDVSNCGGSYNDMGSCQYISLYERFDPVDDTLFAFKGAMTYNEANAYCTYYGGPGTIVGSVSETGQRRTDMLDMINKLGREDIKSRQVPRFYGYWARQNSYGNPVKLLAHKRSITTTSACENQHPFVCERPAAALEGSEFKGTESTIMINVEYLFKHCSLQHGKVVIPPLFYPLIKHQALNLI